MTAVLATLAFSLPGLWARVYTLGLPAPERLDRVQKVDSDVYEQQAAGQQDGSLFPSVEAVVCVATSAWADVTWRIHRGQVHRLAAFRAGCPPFPGFATALMVLAAAVGTYRLSIFHDLESAEHTSLTLAIVVGPVVATAGLLVGRGNPATGTAALLAGSGALAAATLSTVLGPIMAVIGAGAGLMHIAEARLATRAAETIPPDAEETHTGGATELAEELSMSTKLERWCSAGALVFAVGLAAVWVGWDTKVHANNSDTEIVTWYAGGHELKIYAAFLGAIVGSGGLMVFFGGLYASMRRAEGGAGYLSALMLAGATAFAILFMVAITAAHATGMAYAYEDKFKEAGVDPNTVRLLDVFAFTLEAAAAIGASVATGCVAVVSLRSHSVVPAWLGWAAAILALALLFSFPISFITLPLFGLWVLIAGGWRLLSGRGFETAPRRSGAPAPA